MLAGAPPLEAQFFPCFFFDIEIKDWNKGKEQIKKKNVKAKQNSITSSKTAWALRARHLQSICAEIERRRSSNDRVP